MKADYTIVGVGTPGYMAPELDRSAKDSKPDLRLTDVWCVGVMAFYILTKNLKGFGDWRASFNINTLENQPVTMQLSIGIGEEELSVGSLSFITEATIESPAERLNWEKAPSHIWISHYKPTFSALPNADEYAKLPTSPGLDCMTNLKLRWDT